jgi:DNA-binding NarL/FixJ family response regulator
MGESIRVLVVQSGSLMRQAVAQRLEASGVRVVGQAATNAEALVEYAQCYPDVVIVDVRLGAESGLVLICDLLEFYPGAVVVVYSGHGDAGLARQTLAAGAAGYICRGASRAELRQALCQAVAGVRPVLDHRLVEVQSEAVPDPRAAAADPVPQLTARQRQVLDLVAAGTTSNKDLAKELFISEKTVKSHIERITASLDVSRRTQLPLRAVELGLLPVAGREPVRLSLPRPAAAMTKGVPDRRASSYPWHRARSGPTPAGARVTNAPGSSKL